jgi:hypoxia up-regulated 1
LFGVRSLDPAFVLQEKKKIHRKPLNVTTYFEGRVQPHSAEVLAASKQKLVEMAKRDKERMMLEESRNNVEAYIYKIKNKLEDDAEIIEKVTTQEQRDQVRKLAEDAQEWMDDKGYDADFATMEDKFAELSGPFEKILSRIRESTERPAAIKSLRKKLDETEQLLLKWDTTMPHITAEEKEPVSVALNDVRKWIADKEDAQAKKQPHEDPAFLSAEVPLQTKVVEGLVLKLSRKPKPKPVKNETSTVNATATENATAADNATATAENRGNGTIDEPLTKATTEETLTNETAAKASDGDSSEGAARPEATKAPEEVEGEEL